MKRKIISIILILCLAVTFAGSLFSQKTSAAGSFPDVSDPSSSIYTPVYWAVDQGIVKGYSNGNFGPEDSCTREQFVVMIWRLAGKPSASGSVSFSDVSSSRSTYSAMQWAVGQDIIKGFSDGSFRPTDTVTRQQVAIMLWRMAGKPSSGSRTSFTDITGSASGYDAIQWGAAAGLIKGFSDGSFRPAEDCLRQQIVIFLYRYAKNILGMAINDKSAEAGYSGYAGSWKAENDVPLWVEFSKIEGNKAVFTITRVFNNGKRIATAENIEAVISDNTMDFDFSDSWFNTGYGTITFNNGSLDLYLEKTGEEYNPLTYRYCITGSETSGTWTLTR